MKLGIIGYGRAGKVHFDSWNQVDGGEVVAVCDASVTARQAAARLGMAAYADLDHMLDEAELDAVSICTPPDIHAETAVACLDRGLHVLCEKPLALAPWDALRMLQAATSAGRHLLLATKFRHVPDLVLAREMILSGALGEPIAFEISFCSPVDMKGRWNAQRERAGGGVIMDNGCHAFDLISFLFGSLARIHATLLKPLQPLEVEDSATVQIRTEDGVVGRVDLSWSLSTGRDTYVVVYGSQGTVEIGWRGSRARTRGSDWKPLDGPYDKVDAHRRMNERFMEVVTRNQTPWISPIECLRTVGAVDAAYRSLRSNGWEDVDPHPRWEQPAAHMVAV